jgi:hypothetical protein
LLEHHLRAERAGVVGRGHDPPVGADEADRDHVAAARERQLARDREEVAALAKWADEIDLRLLPLVARVPPDEGGRVLGAVEHRAQQVVHAAVADDDRFAAGLLHVQDARDEGADRADQVTARLEDQGRVELPGDVGERSRVSAEIGCRAAAVGNAEPSTGVEVAEPDPLVREPAPELGGTRSRSENRLGVEELRADVEGDPDRLERVVGRRTAENFRRLIAVEAELAAGAPRGQVFVAAAFDVRVQPDGNGCSPAKGARRGGDLVELLDRLDVE